MTYRNAVNPGGVTIDGRPDSPTPGLPAGAIEGAPFWEQVSGPQGSLDIVTELDTDIEGLGVTNYYPDDATPDAPGEVQCTGDAAAYGGHEDPRLLTTCAVSPSIEYPGRLGR